jgi:hypothetical protein
MGMTVSGTVTYGKPLVASWANLPSVVVAISQAVIDKTYLTWLDVNKLLTAFPEHVKLVGDTVIFRGPVAIVSSMSPTRSLFAQCMLGITSGVLCHLFIKATESELYSAFPDSDYVKQGKRIQAAFSLLIIGIGFYLAGRLLPTQAGVYFFRQPPFYA